MNIGLARIEGAIAPQALYAAYPDLHLTESARCLRLLESLCLPVQWDSPQIPPAKRHEDAALRPALVGTNPI